MKLWTIKSPGNTISPNLNATLIYERANGVIYARESGTTEKRVVGYDVTNGPNQTQLAEWNNILRAAETNPALQEALDRVKIIYNLSEQHGQ